MGVSVSTGQTVRERERAEEGTCIKAGSSLFGPGILSALCATSDDHQGQHERTNLPWTVRAPFVDCTKNDTCLKADSIFSASYVSANVFSICLTRLRSTAVTLTRKCSWNRLSMTILCSDAGSSSPADDDPPLAAAKDD